MLIKTIIFPEIGDNRGSLVAIEGNRNLPFDIKRVYYIYDTPSGIARGAHAHRRLKQVLLCLNGSCLIELDNGIERESVRLDRPNQGIVIDSLVWRVMKDFSKGSVLLVLASEAYSEEDYIRNYDEFLAEIKGRK